MEARHRPEIEEQRRIGRALGLAQRVDGAVGAAFVDRDRRVEHEQVGMTRALAQQTVGLDARLLDLTVVEEIPGSVDALPLGLVQGVVHERQGSPPASPDQTAAAPMDSRRC